jgi:Undecaprenyl-phosphate galactose phosphotransferase WbaP
MSTLVKPAPVYGAPAQVLQQRTGLLCARPQRLKRVLDVIFALLLGLFALPVALLIAVAIAIDSPGPVLFTHSRIGKGNRRFRLWKFRSMVMDADEVLDRYLNSHPALAVEWRRSHKLRNDPRVTRVGWLLRRTSLDELPQLWNVLRGDMSMVGPRPIVQAEIAKYGPAFALYSQVLPGLTGLWQVSGRNDTTYRERVELDTRYIRNWTAATDIGVLLRTAKVVLGGRGAY